MKQHEGQTFVFEGWLKFWPACDERQPAPAIFLLAWISPRQNWTLVCVYSSQRFSDFLIGVCGFLDSKFNKRLIKDKDFLILQHWKHKISLVLFSRYQIKTVLTNFVKLKTYFHCTTASQAQSQSEHLTAHKILHSLMGILFISFLVRPLIWLLGSFLCFNSSFTVFYGHPIFFFLEFSTIL